MTRFTALQLEHITVPEFDGFPRPPSDCVAGRMAITRPAALCRASDPRFWLGGELVVSAEDFATLQGELVDVAFHGYDLLRGLAEQGKVLAQVRRQLELTTAVDVPQDKP